MAKVSIIIPVYNVAKYLNRSMDCLLNQTMQDLEFICIDDCSTDNSLEILREYEKKDNRFKIIALDKNRGVSVARNKGLAIASGEYLGFIDPDDTIDLNYYEELYKKAKEKDYDIIKCQLIEINKNKKIIKQTQNNLIKEKGINYFVIEWTTAIYKSSIIFDNNIMFPDEITKGEDTVFLQKIVFNSKTIAIIDNIFYYYYRRNDSLDTKYLTINKLQSALNAIMLMAENSNNFNFNNVVDYYNLYYKYLTKIITFIYRNASIEAYKIGAKNLIEVYNKCKDKQKFNLYFKDSLKDLLPLIVDNDVEKLSKKLAEYKNYQEFKYKITKFKKIFSIIKEDDKNGHLVFRILGLKFSIKLNIRGNTNV